MKRILTIAFLLITAISFGQGKITLRLPQTTSGLSGGNLGSGFRFYYVPSQGIRTLYNGYGFIIDSTSNANGITLTLDTTYATGIKTNLRATNDSAVLANRIGYQWVDRFDDSVSLTGFTNQFTLSHLPTSNLQVYNNGILQTKGRNYTLTDSTITIIDTLQRNIPYGLFSRSGTTVIFTTRYPYYGVYVGSTITVSNATNTALNGIYLITGASPVAQGTQYTYSTTTSGTIASETAAKITLFTPVAKKSVITATYNYTTAQPTIVRYDTANTINIVFYGNSLFQGVGSVTGISDVETQLKAMMPSVPINIVNLGTGGITTPTLQGQITEVLQPNLSTLFKKNIILVTEIVNSYAAGGKNSSQLYSEYKSLCLAIKALDASYKVVATTVLDTKAYMPDSVRVNVNNFIVADNSFYDSLVNTTANTYIGVAGAAYNQDYYNADGVHLYPDGYYEWAKAMYPIVMGLSNLTTQNITQVAIQTSNNLTFNTTGNFPPASTRTMTLGSNRLTRLNVVTNGLTRGYWDSTGSFVLNPALTGTNNAVNITPAFTGTSGSDVYNAVRIAPIFSNGAGGTRNYLTILDYNSGSAEVLTVNASQVSSLYKINAANSYFNAGQINLTAGPVNTGTYTNNSIQFYSGGINTSGASAIGGTTTELQYNTQLKHQFKIGNVERFAVGSLNQVTGGYGENFSITGQANVDGSTTKGLIFTSPGGQPTQINRNATNAYGLDYQTRSSGYHALYVGTGNPALIVDANKNTSNAIASNTTATAGMDLKGSSYTYSSLRIRSGVEVYSTTPLTICSISKTSPATNFSMGVSGTLTVGDSIYIYGASNQSIIPDRAYYVNQFSGNFGCNFYGITGATSTASFSDTTGIRYLFKSNTRDGDIRNDGTNIVLPNNGITIQKSFLIDNTTVAPNNPAQAAASASFEIRSTTKGFLFPKMTTTQRNAIASPAEGLTVYDLTLHKLYVYNGSVWDEVTTTSSVTTGSGTLASGTATISTTTVTASSKIFIQYTSCSSCGSTYISAKTAGTSFVVTSTNGSDASTFDWWIIN